MSILSRRSLIGLCFAPLLVPAIVNAGAIDVPQQGARASGQAEAFAAQADDPSAIWHNPAGLTQLHGTYLQDGGTLVLPFWKFESANGAGSQTMRMPSILPQIYLVSDLGTENLRVGLGANNVFGLNEDWKNDGPLTSIVTQAHLFCYNIAPSVAYQINPHLSLGLDLNVYWGDLELTRRVPLGPGMQDGTFHFRGQDAAVGAAAADRLGFRSHPVNAAALIRRESLPDVDEIVNVAHVAAGAVHGSANSDQNIARDHDRLPSCRRSTSVSKSSSPSSSASSALVLVAAPGLDTAHLRGTKVSAVACF
jgi:hypothetical protein